jgi:HEXXH motif-containing protein
VPEGLLRGLAESTGGPAASAVLAEAQLSKHLLLIAELLRQWPGPAGERDTLVAALDHARQAAPEATARVLGSPPVGAWLAIVSRAAERGRSELADVIQLGAVAAVACAAAGVDAELRGPLRDGVLALPGSGLLTVGAGKTAAVSVAGEVITAAACDGPVSVRPGDPAGGVWQPVRVLQAADVRILLDDVDPYRHGYHAPPAPRLSEIDFERWQALFDEAWRLLATHIPQRSAECAVGLRALVPLQREGNSSALSATIRHVFGVFGLTRPATAADFAITLVHEYQHSKLSALLDIAQLSDPADSRRYFAPWRTDPRPLAGLLQGVYAFAGVADTWRALRAAVPEAEQHFADVRLQVDRSLTSLETSDSLTPTGEHFVAHLRRFTDTLLAEPVAAAAARHAVQRQRELHQRWRAANG